MLIDKLKDLFPDRSIIYVWNYGPDNYLVNAIRKMDDPDSMFVVNKKSMKITSFDIRDHISEYKGIVSATPIYDFAKEYLKS